MRGHTHGWRVQPAAIWNEHNLEARPRIFRPWIRSNADRTNQFRHTEVPSRLPLPVTAISITILQFELFGSWLGKNSPGTVPWKSSKIRGSAHISGVESRPFGQRSYHRFGWGSQKICNQRGFELVQRVENHVRFPKLPQVGKAIDFSGTYRFAGAKLETREQ